MHCKSIDVNLIVHVHLESCILPKTVNNVHIVCTRKGTCVFPMLSYNTLLSIKTIFLACVTCTYRCTRADSFTIPIHNKTCLLLCTCTSANRWFKSNNSLEERNGWELWVFAGFSLPPSIQTWPLGQELGRDRLSTALPQGLVSLDMIQQPIQHRQDLRDGEERSEGGREIKGMGWWEREKARGTRGGQNKVHPITE